MSDKEDTLGKYSRKPYPPLRRIEQTPQLVKSDEPYQAVVKSKGTERTIGFKIYNKEKDFDFYSYPHLLEVSFRNGDLILTMTTRTFTLSGRNLDQIADLLGERKAKAIYEFDPNVYEQPAEEGAAIIESIEREE